MSDAERSTERGLANQTRRHTGTERYIFGHVPCPTNEPAGQETARQGATKTAQKCFFCHALAPLSIPLIWRDRRGPWAATKSPLKRLPVWAYRTC